MKLREVNASYRLGAVGGLGDWKFGVVGRNLKTWTISAASTRKLATHRAVQFVRTDAGAGISLPEPAHVHSPALDSF